MQLNLKNYYFWIAPLLCTVLAIILSGVQVFSNPSRSPQRYLLEFDISQANFSALYPLTPTPDDELTISNTSFTDNVFRFGLWGYCSGSRTVNSAGLVNTGSYRANGCTSSHSHYKIDIPALLSNNFDTPSGYSLNEDWPRVSKLNRKANTIYNSALGGFVLACLTTALLLIGLPVGFFFPFALYVVYIVGMVFTFIQWICMVVASGTAQKLLDDLSNTYTSETYRTVADKGHTWLGISWTAFVFSVLLFVSLSIALVGKIMIDRREAKLQQPYDETEANKEVAGDVTSAQLSNNAGTEVGVDPQQDFYAQQQGEYVVDPQQQPIQQVPVQQHQ